MKKSLHALALLLTATLALAAAPKSANYTLAAVTDRPDALYQTGETAAFTITLTKDGQPVPNAKIKWRITNDGLEPALREGETDTPANGTLTITETLRAPGFLQIRADTAIPGETIPTARAAAACEPEKIQPSLPPPDDFDAYWTQQKQLLQKHPANPILTLTPNRYKNIDVYDLQDATIPNIPLSAYLAKPANAKPRSLPAILLPHAGGVATSRYSIAAQWATDGFIALDFNAHGIPNGQPPEYYKTLYAGPLKSYYHKDTATRETIFFRTLYLRLQRALDILCAQPEWDGKILVVNGRSQGGGQAIAAAGLDPRVTYIAAQIPAMCDHTGAAASRINGWPKLLDNGIPVNAADNPQLLQNVRYFDAMNFATRATAGAILTVGFIDLTCPPTGIYATYNQLRGPKQIHNMPLTGHAGSREADDLVRAAILAHVTSAQK